MQRSPTSPTPGRSSTRPSPTSARGRRSASPIGSFQHNKFLLADLVTRVEVTQAYVDQCVVAHSRGAPRRDGRGQGEVVDGSSAERDLDHCVQLHGGYGYMNEYRVARAWKDARVTKIWAGSNEIMKELIGRDLGL